jgi:acetyl-CoA C-acetyltransferase
MKAYAMYVSFLLPRQNPNFGKIEARDSLENDGLLDAYDKVAMGNCAELCAERNEISRESLDAHAIESYRRAERAWKEGAFDAEVVPVVIKGKKGDTVVKEDEEYKKVIYEKIPTLKSAFKQGGRITAANSSSINDGASALILMSAEKAKELGVKPLAKIICELPTQTDLMFEILTCMQHMLTVVWSRNSSLRLPLSRFLLLWRGLA